MSLINAAHWLWTGARFMSFNVAISSNCHAEFETEDQFRAAASAIARNARTAASALDERFSSFDAIADFVIDRAGSSLDRMSPSWWGYEAGIASGLVGRPDDASRFLRGVSDERVGWRAVLLLPLTADADAFRRKVGDVVAKERARLKLAPLDDLAF